MLRALILLSLLAIPTAAYSQGSNPRAEGEKTCSQDARRVCRKVLNSGDMVALACLQQNRTRISRSCDKFLRKMGQ